MASAVDWVPKKGDLAGYAWTHLLDLIHSCGRCVVRATGVCVVFVGEESKGAAAYVGMWYGRWCFVVRIVSCKRMGKLIMRAGATSARTLCEAQTLFAAALATGRKHSTPDSDSHTTRSM